MEFFFLGLSLLTTVGCAECLKRRRPMYAAALGWASVFYFITALLERSIQ